MPGQEDFGHGLPVGQPLEGLTQNGIPAGSPPGIDAHEHHGTGGIIHRLKAPGKAHGAAAGQIGGHQSGAVGVKGLHELLRPPDGAEGNLLPGQGPGPLPPVAADPKHQLILLLQKHIGPSAQGTVPAALGNGHIQQSGQSSVGGFEGDGHGPLSRPDGGHLRQPGAVEGAVPGFLQGAGHQGRGHGTSIGEGHLRAEGKGPGPPVLGGTVVLAQDRVGLKALVQGKKSLIEQTAQIQVGAVVAGDWVKAVLRVAGQSKFYRFRLRRCGGHRGGGGRRSDGGFFTTAPQGQQE